MSTADATGRVAAESRAPQAGASRWDVLVMALFGLAIYALAIRMRLPRAAVEALVGDVTLEAEQEDLLLGVGQPA